MAVIHLAESSKSPAKMHFDNLIMSEFKSGMLFVQMKDLILSYGVITSS